MIFNESYEVLKDDYTNAGTISSRIKKTLASIGVSSDVIRRIAVASYEAEINMIIHSYGGTIDFQINKDNEINLIFKDKGPGIKDMEKALTPGYSTASEKARQLGFGAGMGLFNIKRVSDRFDIKSSSEGTTLTIGFDLK